MRKYKLIEYFVDGSVREMCIKYNFYTRGDNDAYCHMLNMEIRKPTIAIIEKMAVDIKAHSETSCNVIDIMNLINDECVYHQIVPVTEAHLYK